MISFDFFSKNVSGCLLMRQVHGQRVLHRTARENPSVQPEGDAQWTTEPNLKLGVLTADCLPIILSHSGYPFIGVVHAGWRGVLNGVVQETLRTVQGHFGGSIQNWKLMIGPHIQASSYEFGSEEATNLCRKLGVDVGSVTKSTADPSKVKLDLASLLLLSLDKTGFSVDATICRADTFSQVGLASFRRDRSQDRNLTWAQFQ